MAKSGACHADAIRFWGHIHTMHYWRNSSIQLGNKMVESSNIDSYHNTFCSPLFCKLNSRSYDTTVLWYYLWFPLKSHTTDSVFLGCNHIASWIYQKWFNTNIMHYQRQTIDSPSVITFSTEKPRILITEPRIHCTGTPTLGILFVSLCTACAMVEVIVRRVGLLW